MPTTPNSSGAVSLEHICSLEDVFHRHLLPFLSHTDAGPLESVSQTLRSSLQANNMEAWKILCDRDFRGSATTPSAPVYSDEKESFDDILPQQNWKHAYQKWSFWKEYTAGGSTAQHMMQAVKLWKTYKQLLEDMGMHNILESLSNCLSRHVFRELVDKKLPSSLIAFFSVHGGQLPLRPRAQDHEFFAGLFGSYSCYNNFYSMRLLNMEDFIDNATNLPSMTLIGISPGNPRMFLYLVAPNPEDDNDNNDDNNSDSYDPEGTIVMVHNNPLSSQSIQAQHSTVGRGGILSYFQSFIERLQDGTYKPCQVIPESPSSRGFGLFPDAGDQVSICVTRGIEVKASARWFPGGIMDQVTGGGMNFGYSVRIQKVIPEDNNNNADIPETCQLVGRHLEFMNGNGNVRRVDGDGVIGKQPLFFLENGKSGFVDLGVGGDGRRYSDEVFVYQSQSGPVEGTTRQDTGSASVTGTFSFVPGSIDDPTGPMFHVTVGKFPFQVPFPFY